jgi:hypothetical protein
MKKFAAVLLGCATLTSAHAQLLQPEAWQGLLLGGLIGGLAGAEGCDDFSGKDAAVGAGIGLLAGSLLGESRRSAAAEAPGYTYGPAPGANVNLGYGYGSGGGGGYVGVSSGGYYAPTGPAPTSRPNYAVGGALLGAASGALIGAGNDEAGEGAAIGAAAGLILGGAKEYATRREERQDNAEYIPAAGLIRPAPQAQPAAPAIPTNPGPHAQITSTPGPTSTYTWTPRPESAEKLKTAGPTAP